MQQDLGVSCRQVKAYFQAAGGLNGGTLASAVHLVRSGQASQLADLFLLNPTDTVSPAVRANSADPQWPHYDRALKAWTAPFFMGPVNTRVVRRSCALYDQWQASYGSDFTYQEYLKFAGSGAAGSAIAITLTTGLFAFALSQPWAWFLLQSRLPQPGNGPSAQVMDEGWFSCELIGWSEDEPSAQCWIYNPGDPGNRSTVKFLCESALCLVQETEKLPKRGGVLTPATGLGDVLADRLRQAGMTIKLARYPRTE
jgi:short subunit dehydrogenase-like uncharacterized protein